MNRITPIVLLALLVAAGTYVALVEIPRGGEGERVDTAKRVFTASNTDAEGVREMTLARDGGAVTLARGRDGLWRLTAPVEALARDSVVNNVVRDLLFLRKTGGDIPRDQFTAKGLAAYGLEKPRMVVRLRAGEGASTRDWELRVGAEDPTKQYVYAMQPSDTGVSLVDKYVIDRLALSANDFRETRFVRFDPSRVTSLKLRSALANRLELAKKEGRWSVTSPFEDRADSLRLEGVMRALGEVEAKAFAAEAAGNLAPFGLDRPRVEATFTRDDNSTSTVLLGAPAREPVGTVYAKLADAPAIYAVDESLVEKLTFPSDFLRDRRVAMVSTFGVREIVVERPGARVVVAKDKDKWKITEPVPVDAEESEVDGFVRAVSDLEIVRFPNDAPDDAALARYGLDDKSRATVTLKLADKPDLVLYVGRVDEKQKDLYLRRAGTTSIYAVKESFAARAAANWLDFRTRKVASMGKYDFQKISLRRPQGDVTLEKAADGKWRLTAPVVAVADEVNVGSLCDDLNDLSAVKFLAAKAEAPADFGFDKPTCEVTVTLQSGRDKPAETKTVLIGREIKDVGWAAQMKGEDLVFVASNVLVEHLGQEMRKRLVWESKRQDVTAVVWQSGERKVSARRDEGVWKAIEPAGARLDDMALEDMVGSVEYLRVTRFEDYTKDHLAKYGLDPSAALGAGKPRATLTLTVEGRDRVLYVGAPKDKDNVYACVSTEDVVFTLPQSVAAALLKSPLAPPATLAPPAE